MAKQRARSEKERLWRELVQRQEQSGRSIRAFCASESISEASFHWWRRELARRKAQRSAWPTPKRQAPAPTSRPKLVPVAVAAPPLCPAIEIELRGGVMVRVLSGATRQLLCEVLSALEQHRC
jgi:transposase